MFLFLSDATLRRMRIALRNKAIFLYRFVLVNVDNARSLHSDEKEKPGKRTRPAEDEQTGTVDNSHKRQNVDLVFHLLGVMAGFEFAMIFTNWTTIPDNQFTTNDIVDEKTLWVRFAGSITGMAYVVITCINSFLISRKKRQRRARPNREAVN